MSDRNLWIALFDIHYPKIHRPTWKAVLHCIKVNAHKIAGLYLGGDQLDNEEISHHNQNKILFRVPGSYARHTKGFNEEILQPLEKLLPNVVRVWQKGNHDDWEEQLVQEQPELLGTIERSELLKLEERGWTVIPCGGMFRIGKLTCIHGETLSGFGNQGSTYHAKKAVENYGRSILYGHMHSPQSYARVAPFTQTDKFMAWCSPIIGSTNPNYLRNRPTAWVNGFTIVETLPNGNFNVYPVIVSGGTFSFGGVVYGAKS